MVVNQDGVANQRSTWDTGTTESQVQDRNANKKILENEMIKKSKEITSKKTPLKILEEGKLEWKCVIKTELSVPRG